MEEKKNLKLIIICVLILLAIIGGTVVVIFTGNGNGDSDNKVEGNIVDKEKTPSSNQNNGQNSGQSNQQSTGLDIDLSEDMFLKAVEYTNADKETESAYKNSVLIDLNNGSPKCVNTSVRIEGTTVTILASGKYTITGTMDEGQIIVSPAIADEDNVKILWDSVTISNSKSAPFVSKAKGKTVITLKDGTENVVSDLRQTNNSAASNMDSADIDSTETEEDNDSAIWCENDLSINGSGKLKVTANYESGIKSKDDLVVYSGELNIDAANNALVGNDSVAIKSGTFTLKTDNNGIRCKTNDDASKGYIVIDGGKFDIEVSGAAIKSEFTAIINDGDIKVLAGSDAVHGEYGVQINKGSIIANKCEEGIEGAYIVINDGEVDITALDDGINASNGTEETTMDNGFGMQPSEGMSPDSERPQMPPNGMKPQRPGRGEKQKDSIDNGNTNDKGGKGGFGGMGVEDASLIINGGTIKVNAGGDGLDSNGDIIINGGTIYVNGPTNNGNSPIDAGKGSTVNGGEVIIVGSSGMLEAPTENGKQNCIVITFNSLEGGSVISVKDEEDNEVMSYESPKTFSALVYSSDKLETGKTYTVLSGDTVLATLTISSTVTTSGNVMGGFMR